jgi:hypothetical protein
MILLVAYFSAFWTVIFEDPLVYPPSSNSVLPATPMGLDIVPMLISMNRPCAKMGLLSLVSRVEKYNYIA